MGETKRPTAQDIEALRKRVDATWCRIFEVKPIRSRDDFMEYQRQWHNDLRVLDYAESRRKAEEEAERVPEDDGPPRRGDVWYCWDGLITAVVIEVRECGGWNVTISGRDGIVPWSPESVAAVQDSPTWERVRRGPPKVKAPEDAGDDGTDDPEARVRAMSDEEVETALTEHGVGPWMPTPLGLQFRLWLGDVLVVGADGLCWDRAGDRFDDVTGDTTTPEGRAECSRRLLVHLLREDSDV